MLLYIGWAWPWKWTSPDLNNQIIWPSPRRYQRCSGETFCGLYLVLATCKGRQDNILAQSQVVIPFLSLCISHGLFNWVSSFVLLLTLTQLTMVCLKLAQLGDLSLPSKPRYPPALCLHTPFSRHCFHPLFLVLRGRRVPGLINLGCPLCPNCFGANCDLKWWFQILLTFSSGNHSVLVWT